MTDYLLTPDLVVDLLSSGDDVSDQMLQQAERQSDGLWLYVGAMESMRQMLAERLATEDALTDAGRRIWQFAKSANWLAALAADGDCIAAKDPLEAQLVNALGRLGDGAIRLESADDYLAADKEDGPVPFIDLAMQQRMIRPGIEEGLLGVLAHGRYIGGPEINELEARLSDYCDVKHAIAVSNGTDALLIALLAAGVGPGDEVITSPFTFAATGEMILLLGARPIYADIDPVTYNLDPEAVAPLIGERTRAIIPVSIFGQTADMDGIYSLVEGKNIRVIEDAAQSFGATSNGRRSCALSDIACTSFFPSKPLGGYGDSGACFTDSDELADALRQIRDHGQTGRYQHTRLGLNGRMSSFQASVLLRKLELFEKEAPLRAEVGDRYTSMLIARGAGESLDIVPPMLNEGNVSVYAQYSVLVNQRDQVQAKMQQAGIPTAVHYPVPLNRQPALFDESCHVPVCEDVSSRVMSLPMHPYLREDQQIKVLDALVSAVESI